MSIEKSIVFIHPIALVLFELKEVLEETGEYTIYEMDDLAEYAQTVGILDYSITFSTDLKKTSKYLQANKKFVKQPTSKNIVLSNKKVSPVAVNKLQKFGMDEMLPEETNIKSLSHKIDMFFRPFEKKAEKEREEKEKATTDFKVLSQNSQKEEINTNEKVRIERMSVEENSAKELDPEAEKERQQRELEMWMKQSEKEEQELRKKEELEKNRKEEIKAKQEEEMQAWIAKEEKLKALEELEKKKQEEEMKAWLEQDHDLEEKRPPFSNQKTNLRPVPQINMNFMSKNEKQEKKDPKVFKFGHVEKGKEFNFVDHNKKQKRKDFKKNFKNEIREGQELEIELKDEKKEFKDFEISVTKNKREYKELEINLSEDKKEAKEYEINLSEDEKISKEYEMELEDNFGNSKELEITLDKEKEGMLLEASLRDEKKEAKELEIKLNEAQYSEYELELEEEIKKTKELEIELDKKKEKESKDLNLKDEMINASEYEIELDEEKKGAQINFTDKKELPKGIDKTINIEKKEKEGIELEIRTKHKKSKLFDFTQKSRKPPKIIQADIKFDKKEGIINNKISKSEEKDSQFDFDLKQQPLQERKAELKFNKIERSEQKKKDQHKFVTLELDRKIRQEDQTIAINKNKIDEQTLSLEEQEKKRQEVTEEVLVKLQKGNITLDYSTFDRKKRKSGNRLRPKNVEPSYDEIVEKLLEEPEKNYYDPKTYGLEFITLLQDLYEHPKVIQDHIFKFISFSLSKNYQGTYSIFVFDSTNNPNLIYEGHNIFKIEDIDFENLKSLNINQWKESSIPTWSDETFQEKVNEFVYPLFEDNIQIGFVIAHFQDSIHNHKDAAGAEMMIMSCRGAAFSIYPFGGKE